MSLSWIFIALAIPAEPTAPPEPCHLRDRELIDCPAPETPRVTELTGGLVTLEIQTNPDGSVRASKVVSSSGHPAWQGAAQAAVAKWRYAPDRASRTREASFEFRLGGR